MDRESRLNEPLIISFDQIRPLVEETHQAMFSGKKYRYKTNVLSQKEMSKRFGEDSKGHCYAPFLFFSHPCFRQIYLCENSISNILIVAGHEIGHLQKPFFSANDLEETKAFLFQLYWGETIMEKNIGNLAETLNLRRRLDCDNYTDFPLHQGAYLMAESIYQRNPHKWEKGLQELKQISRPPTDRKRIGLSVH